jgi:hypothetical protein
MGLPDQLRKAEQKTSLAPQQQINRARKEWADAERRLRRKMRIYRDESVSIHVAIEDQTSLSGDLRLPVGGRGAEGLRDPEAGAAREAIVSIYGRDVKDDAEIEDNECGHLIQSR